MGSAIGKRDSERQAPFEYSGFSTTEPCSPGAEFCLNLAACCSESQKLFLAKAADIEVYQLGNWQRYRKIPAPPEASAGNVLTRVRCGFLGCEPVLVTTDTEGWVVVRRTKYDADSAPASWQLAESCWGIGLPQTKCRSSLLLVSANTHSLHVLDWRDGRLEAMMEIKGHEHNVPSVDICPFAPLAASCSIDGTVRLSNFSAPHARSTASLVGGRSGAWCWACRCLQRADVSVLRPKPPGSTGNARDVVKGSIAIAKIFPAVLPEVMLESVLPFLDYADLHALCRIRSGTLCALENLLTDGVCGGFRRPGDNLILATAGRELQLISDGSRLPLARLDLRRCLSPTFRGFWAGIAGSGLNRADLLEWVPAPHSLALLCLKSKMIPPQILMVRVERIWATESFTLTPLPPAVLRNRAEACVLGLSTWRRRRDGGTTRAAELVDATRADEVGVCALLSDASCTTFDIYPPRPVRPS